MVSYCRIMLGLMLSTWFPSVGMSNTATESMMIPLVEVVLTKIKTAQDVFSEEDNTYISKRDLLLL